MALVSNGFFLNVSLADAAGNKANLRYDLDYANWAALNTAVGAGDIAQILTDLDGVTDGTVTAYNVGQAFIEDASPYGIPGSEVENIALVTAQIAGALDKYASLRIPAPRDGVFLAMQGEKRNVVDTTFVPFQTYMANFGPVGHVLVSDGERIADPAVAGNVKGKRIHRGSRKG